MANNKNKKTLEFGMNAQNDEKKTAQRTISLLPSRKSFMEKKKPRLRMEYLQKRRNRSKSSPLPRRLHPNTLRLHPQKALLPQHLHRLLPPLRPHHCTSPTSHLSPLNRPLSPRTPSLRVRSSPNPISRSAVA